MSHFLLDDFLVLISSSRSQLATAGGRQLAFVVTMPSDLGVGAIHPLLA
jgi:hypothetical protein